MRPEIQRPATRRPALHRRFFPGPALRPSGLYPGEPEACRRDLRQLGPILLHFFLLLAVFKVYHVEGRAFQILVPLALAALPGHYLLPYRWKKPAFVAVSAAGLVWVFGAATSSFVLASAAVLIAVCRAPVAWGLRAATVAALGAALAWARPHSFAVVPDNVWPVLASMFMFRIMLYLYELKHAKTPEPLLDTLSYFVLLPNFCFTHFPVVDYRTMQRGYFAHDVHATMRRGLRMMFQGLVHLLLYRLVYHDLWIKPDEVVGAATLARHVVCNYLLYLQVSGQFHVACGMLHLFGFHLPETHHNYLLATSFTDYWRRINIYWKDFMVRLVFNPLVFRLKRWPQPVALAAAAALTFGATWALHAYQWYWLRGDWSFSRPDALFWGILGLLVVINVQFDLRRSRARLPKATVWCPAALALRALQTAGTFVTIALLWSLWSSPSVGAWVAMLRRGLGG